MRKFRVYLESSLAGVSSEEEFEMEDDATEEDIKQMAEDIFFSEFNYSYEEITEEEK